MHALLALFLALCALEYLFWLSPMRGRFDAMTDRMGRWFLVLPFHYWLRLALLCAVMLLWPVDLPPVFTQQGWGVSLGLGVLLCLLSYMAALRLWGVRPGPLKRKVSGWLLGGARSWGHLAYITAYPAFVEELLFRWYIPALLWPVAGWWTLLAAPVLNLVWHLPVWYDMVRRQGAGMGALAGVAVAPTVLAVLLTVIWGLSGNIAGAVLAHAFGDWLGSVWQRKEA